MADKYIEYDYLPEKKQRRCATKKRLRWPYVLLGFFMGFITMPAVIAVTVLVFVNRPVGKTADTIDGITNAGLYETLFGDGGDNLGLLDEKYSDMKLKDAIGDISAIAGKGNQLTFDDLAGISPQIEKTVDNLIESAEEKNIHLDKENLMTTPLSQFSDLLMAEVKEISLGEVLLATSPEIFDNENSGAIMKNLFFGTEGINYTETNGTIEMLPLTYTYDSASSEFLCIDETVYTKDATVWTAENGNYIENTDDGYVLYSSNGDLLHQLQANNARTITSFTAVTIQDGMVQTVKQQPLMLGAFMDENNDPMSVIGKLDLGVLLGINNEEAATAEDNKMLVALAYGALGTDYDFEDGKVVPLNGKSFTTLGDLMDAPADVLNNILLGSILGIKTNTDVETADALLVSLSYGTYEEDFYYDENGNIKPKDGGKPFTTLSTLMATDGMENLMESIPLNSIFAVDVFDENADTLTLSLVYGTKGKHYTIEEKGGEQYIHWLINEETGEEYHVRTFGELRDGDLTSLVNDIKIGDIFEIDSTSSKLLVSIQDWTVEDLGKQEKIDSIPLSNVVEDVNSNFYLKHLSNSTLGTLTDDINNLTIMQLFENSIMRDSNGEITGTWKYLLTWNWDETLPNAPNKTYVAPEDYKVTDMDALIENMHNNIETATLRALKTDGMAPHLDETTLNSTLICRIGLFDFTSEVQAILYPGETNPPALTGEETIGDLSVIQASHYLSLLLDQVNTYLNSTP